MRPCFEPGDRLLVSSVEVDSIKLYQVIVFATSLDSSNLVAHRVLKLDCQDNEPVFFTQGDNPQSSFAMVRTGQVKGRVVGKIKNDRPVYFGRMTELVDYLRSICYWRFKMHTKWLLRIILNCLFPFLRKKLVLYERQEKEFIVKATIFDRTLGTCRIKAGKTHYYFSDHLIAFWKKSLQSKLQMQISKMDLACKNTML